MYTLTIHSDYGLSTIDKARGIAVSITVIASPLSNMLMKSEDSFFFVNTSCPETPDVLLKILSIFY